MEIIQDTFSDYFHVAIFYLPKYLVAIVTLVILAFILFGLRKKISTYLISRADDKLLVNFIDSTFKSSI